MSMILSALSQMKTKFATYTEAAAYWEIRTRQCRPARASCGLFQHKKPKKFLLISGKKYVNDFAFDNHVFRESGLESPRPDRASRNARLHENQSGLRRV